jgi:hypothetical protein
MNPVSEDVKDMLAADSELALIFATNLFIGNEPAEPDECVTIFDTPGYPPQLNLDSSERYENPSIQIRVRGMTYNGAFALADLILSSLHGRARETWNTTFYALIKCANGPFLLDWDENERPRFVLNFDIQRR